MSEPWVGVLKTTIPEYSKKVGMAPMRRRAVIAMLEKKGKVSKNHHGTYMSWRVEKKRNRLQVNEDMQQGTYQRINRYEEAILGWKSYRMSEVYSRQDMLRNSGPEAIVKDVSGRVSKALDNFGEAFNDEFYNDGNAAANAGRMHGFQSFTGHTGSALTGNTRVLDPSDTYAGLLTNLGNYGGTWSTSSGNVNWPNGTGDLEYEFWSPTIINYRSTDFSAGATWAAGGPGAMRYALTASSRNKQSMESRFFLLERTMLEEFKNEIDYKERILVDKADSPLRSLGFQALRYDGVDVIDEYGLPTTTGTDTRCGMLLDVDSIELCIQGPEMYVVDGPTYDQRQQAWIIDISIYGNFKFETPSKQVFFYGL